MILKLRWRGAEAQPDVEKIVRGTLKDIAGKFRWRVS
jgi:hypothetical protein